MIRKAMESVSSTNGRTVTPGRTGRLRPGLMALVAFGGLLAGLWAAIGSALPAQAAVDYQPTSDPRLEYDMSLIDSNGTEHPLFGNEPGSPIWPGSTMQLRIVLHNAGDKPIDVLLNSDTTTQGGIAYRVSGSDMTCSDGVTNGEHLGIAAGAAVTCTSGPLSVRAPINSNFNAGVTYQVRSSDGTDAYQEHPVAISISPNIIVAFPIINLVQNDPTLTTDHTDGSVEVGDKIVWNFTATNSGDYTLNSVAMTDERGGTYTCAATTIDPGQSTTCASAPYTVTATDLSNGKVENRGTVTAISADPNNLPVTVRSLIKSVPVSAALQAGSLELTKTGPASVPLGGEVTYTLSLHNPGEKATKSSATVTDPIPTAILGSSVKTSTDTGTIDVAGGSVVWHVPAAIPAGGTVTATITGNVRIDATPGAGALSNTATLTSTECDTKCSDTVTTDVTDTEGKVSLTKIAPGSEDAPVHPGTKVTYQFKVENTGQVDLTNLTIKDTGVVFESDQVVCPGTNDNLIPKLSPGASVTCTMDHTFTLDDLATTRDILQRLTNTATVSGTDPNGVPVEDTASTYTFLDVITQATLTKEIVSPAPGTRVHAGDKVRYKIHFTYDPSSETPMRVTQWNDVMLPDMPSSCDPVMPSVIDPGFTTTCEGPETEYTVTEADIRNNWDAGVIWNRAAWTGQLTVWPNQSLERWGDVSIPLDKDTPQVALTGTKEVSQTSAVPGDTLTYTVTATNSGQLTATNVVVKDAFKGGAPTAIDPAKCVWPGPAGTLAPKQTVTCTYTYDVTDADANSKITNSATAEGMNDTTPVGPTDLGNTSVDVGTGVDLTATKVSSVGAGARVKPGQSFDYTISIVNDGGTAATGVTLQDQLPAGLVFDPSEQDGWTISGSHAQTAPGSELTVPAHGHTEATLSVKVADNATGEQTLKNVAAIDGMATIAQCTANPDLKGCAVDTKGVVVDDSNLTITKNSLVDPVVAGGPKQVKKGQQFRYELVVRNSGVSPVTGETITDQLPAGLAFASASQDGWQPLSGTTAKSTPISLGDGGQTTLYLDVVVTDDAVAGKDLVNVSAIDSMASIADCQANADTKGCGVDRTPVTVVDHSQVEITKSNDIKSDPKVVKVGDTYTYTITVHNKGTQTAYGVMVSDTLSSKLVLNGDQSATWKQDGATLSLKTPVNLAPDETRSFDIAVKVAPGASGTIDNAAALDDQDPADCPARQAAPGCGPDMDPPTVDNTEVTLAKTSGLPQNAEVKPGATITYTLTATNNGTETATGRTIADMVPEGTRLVASSATGWNVTGDGGPGSRLETDPFDIAPNGGTHEATFQVTVLDTAVAGSKIRNVATVGPTTLSECISQVPVTGKGCAEDNRQPTVNNAKIEITKTNNVGSPALVKKGDKFRYTIAVQNTGDSTATGTTVVDQLPPGLAFDTASSQSGWAQPVTGDTATSLPLTLAGHSPVQYLYLDVVVTDAAKVGDVLTNIAAVTGMATPAECAKDDTRTMDGCAWDDNEVQVTDHSNVEISKVNDVPDPKVVKVNDHYTYTITVHNKGTQPALGVAVSDTLTDYLGFYGTPPSDMKISGKTISLITPVNLDPGQTKEYSFGVQVLPGATGQLHNVAVLDDVDPATCTATGNPWGCGVDEKPPSVDNTNVKLTKTSGLQPGARVKPGATMTYTFTATNSGTETATGVRITDMLPAQVTFADQDGWTAGTTAGTVVSDPFDVPPGNTPVTKTLIVTVKDDAKNGETVRNVATVGPTPIATCLSDSSLPGCAEDNRQPTIDDSNVTITKQTDTPGQTKRVRVGDQLTYTILISNTGEEDATGVRIVEQLPAGLAFDPASSQPGWQQPISGDTATSLAITVPGKSSDISLPIDVVVVDPAKAGDVLTNVAAIQSVATPQQCLDDASRTLKGCAWDSTVLVTDHSQVSIHKSNNVPTDPKVVKVGDTYTYQIDVVNDGDETAYGVVVADTLPDGLAFDGDQAPWLWVGNSAAISVDVPAHKTTSLYLHVRVADGAAGYLKNLAFMDDQDPDQCSLSQEAHGCAPDLDPPRVDNTKVSLEKTNSLKPGARVKPGDTFTYTFTATNSGTEAAPNITVTDQLPEQVELYPSDQPGWTPGAGGIITSDAFTVGPNKGTHEVSFQVRVKADAAAETKIRNVGTVGPTSIADCVADPQASGAGCAQDNNQPVVDQSKIQITKSNNVDDPKLVKNGSTYQYTIAVQNTGDSPASGIVIADQLPQGVTFDPASKQPGWQVDAATGIATSLPIALPAHSDETYLYLDVLVTGAKAGDVLTNVAANTGAVKLADCVADTTQTLSGCAWDAQPVTVTDHAGVEIVKKNSLDAPYVVTPGQQYIYTITVTNKGTAPALGVQVSDTISDKLQIVTPLSDKLKIDGQTVSLKVPVNLDPTESASYDIPVKVRDGAKGQIDNVSVLDDQDPTTCDTATKACGIDPHPPTIDNTNVALAKDSGLTAGARVKAGDHITYTFTATNTGIENASGVVITDQLPSQVKLDPDPQTGWAPGTGTGVIESDPFTVPAGGAPITKTVRVIVLDTAKSGDVIRNVGTVGPTAIADCVTDSTLKGCAEDKNKPIFDDSALTVVKVNDVANANKYVTAGETFHYTLTVHNSGESTATGVTITDQVPAALEVLSPDPLAWNQIGTNLFQSKPFDLVGGGTQELKLTVRVKDGTAAETLLTNISAIDSMKTIQQCTDAPTDPGCGVDQAPVTVVDHSKVKVTKVNDVAGTPKVVHVGDTFHYTLTVTNTDTAPAYNVLVSDVLPTGLEFAGAQTGWTLGTDGTASRTIATLAPNTPVEYTLTVRVVDGATGLLRNVSVIDTTDPATCPTSGTIPPNCGPDLDPPNVDNTKLSLTKTSGLAAGARVKLGAPITYTFTARNDGTEDATGVVITDQLPDQVTMASGQTDWNAPDASGVVTSKPFTVAAGKSVERTLLVTVKSTAPSGSVVRNVGTVGPTPIATCVTNSKLPGCAEDDRQPIVDDSNIQITKSNTVTDPKTVTVGAKVKYAIQIENKGQSTADAVVVEDQLPAGLTFDTASAQSGWASTDPATGLATSLPLTMTGGYVTTLYLDTIVTNKADLGSTLLNVAAVDGVSTPQECLDDQARTRSGCAWDETLRVVDHSKVEIEKHNSLTGTPPSVRVGSVFTYTITATNHDTQVAKDVTISDTLPAYLQLSGTQDDRWKVTNGNRTLTYTTDIGANKTVSLPIQVAVVAPAMGIITNVATLDDVDPATCVATGNPWGCAVDDNPPRVDNTRVAIAKTHEGVDGTRVRAGQDFTYVFTLTNTGSETATGRSVTDLLPAGLEVYPTDQSAWGAFDAATRQIQSKPVDVPAGGTPVRVELKVRVAANAAALTKIVNVGSLDGTTPVDKCLADPTAPLPAGCATDETPLVVDDSAITLAKSNDLAAPYQVQVDDPIHYTIEVTNTGQADATKVQVTDLLPEGLEFVGQQDTRYWQTPTGASIQSVELTIPGKSTLKLPLSVKVSQGATVGGVLTNVVALDGTATPAQCAADSQHVTKGCAWDETAPTVVDHSAIKVTKSNNLPNPAAGTQPRVVAGQEFTYRITATNTATTGTARGVMLRDTLPDGLTFKLPLPDGLVLENNTAKTNPALTLTAGQSISFDIPVVVSSTASGTLRNVAVLDDQSPADCDPATAVNACGFDPRPPYVDTVTLTKQAIGQERIKPGDLVTYTFTATNTGKAPVTGYQIIDSIPTGARLDPNPQDGWTIQAGTGTGGPRTVVTGAPFDLAVGQAVTKTLTVRVDTDATAGQVIRNVATMANGRTPIADCVADPSRPDCVSDQTKPVVDDSDVTIAKRNDIKRTPVTVQAGDPFTYWVTVTNKGDTPAAGVQVTDQLPEGLEFAPNQDSQWLTPTGDTIQSTKLTVTKGTDIELPINVVVTDEAKVGSTLVNVAALDTVATPAECRADATMTLKGCAYDKTPPSVVDHSAVTVTKSNDVQGSPKLVKPGETYTYTITATNNDTKVAARNVVLHDALPKGLSFAAQTDDRWLAPVGNTIASQPLDIDPGKSATLKLVVTVDPTAQGTLYNAATKDAEPAPDCSIKPVSPECDQQPPAVDTVKLSKSASVARVAPGGQVTYTLTADNTAGTAMVPGYRIIDSVPRYTSIDPATLRDWQVVSGAGGSGTIIQTDQFDVPAGGTISKSFTVTVDKDAAAGLTIRNVATMESGRTPITDCVADPTKLDCVTDETKPIVDDSQIVLEKDNSLTDPRTVMNDQPFTYYVKISNQGAMPKSGVTVTDKLPAGLVFADGDQDSRWQAPSGDTITSTDLTVTQGSPITLPIRVVAKNPAVGTTLINVVALDGTATPDQCAADQTHTLKGCAWDIHPPLAVDHSKVTVAKENNVTGTPKTVKPNQTFTYKITATNGDQAIDARDVTLTDTLPVGLVFAPQTDSRWNAPVGQTITSTKLLVPAGKSVSLDLQVQVAPNATGVLRNVVVKDTGTPPNCATDATAQGCDPQPPQVNTVVPRKVSDVPDGDRVKPGRLVTYTLIADNTKGANPVTGYGFIDQVPAGMILDPVDQTDWKLTKGTGAAGSQVTSDPTFTVPAGGTVERKLTMRVDPNAVNGQVIRNVGAIVNGQTPIATCVTNPTLPDCFEENTDHAVDDSVIQIAKTNDVRQSHKMVTPGQPFSYQLRITNTGQSDATNVRITDELPAGLTFAADQDSQWGAPSADGRTIVSAPLTVHAGQPVLLPIKVVVADGATGTLVNIAAVNGMATIDQCKADRTHAGCAWDATPVTVDNTKVSATKTPSIGVNDQVKPGQTFHYTFTATNDGSEKASGVVVTDKLPAGLILDPATPSPDFTSPAVGGIVTSEPFDLEAKASKTLTLNVVVDPNAVAGSIIKNVGTITKATDDGPSIDACVADPSATGCVKEPGQHEVNDSHITLTKRNSLSGTPPLVFAGEPFSYQIQATNDGESTADGVTITDTLPAGIEFAGTQDSAWGEIASDGRTITSLPFTVLGHRSHTLTLTVKVAGSVTAGATLTNAAAVDGKATPAECLAGTKTDGCALDTNAPKVVDHSGVQLDKKNSLTGTPPRVTVGDTFTYTLTATNTSSFEVRGVTISDTLPAGIELAGTQDDRWIMSNGNRTLTYIATLAANGSVSLPINVRVAEGASGTIENAGMIDGKQPDCTADPKPAGCDKNPPWVDTVVPAKTSNVADGDRVRPGQQVTYTFTARNIGDKDVAAYGFTDQVPAGMELAPNDQADWKIQAGSGTGKAGTVVASDPLFAVPAGKTVTRTLTMTVAADAKNGVVIRNVGAVVNGKTPVETCVTNPALPDCYQEPTDHAVDDSDITLRKVNSVTQSHKLVTRGQQFTYTIEATNHGGSTATKVTLTDLLPAGLTFDGTQDTNFWATPTDARTISTVPLDIKGGQTVTLTLKVKVADGASGTLTNVAAVDSKVTPAQCAADWTLSGCGVDQAPVTVDNTALAATKTASVGDGAPIKPGQAYSYTITAKNSGSEGATGVRITDKLPAGVTWARSDDFPTAPVGGVATSRAFDLAAGASLPLTLNVVVDANAASGTQVRNIGSITKPNDDGPSIDECVKNPALPQCFTEPGTHTVDDSNITVAKSNSLSGTPPLVTAGQVFTYTLTVTNLGTSADNHVVVTDLLPAGLSFEPTSQSGWTFDGLKATSAVLSLNGHTQTTLTLSVKVGEGMKTGTQLKNVSAVAGSTSGGTDVEDCVTDPTKPGCGPDINPPEVVDHSKVQVTKVNSLGTAPVVRVGDSFTYTITATNTGTLPVTNVKVSDTLPAGLALAGLPAGWQINGDELFFYADLKAGETVTKTISVTVVKGASGTLKNKAILDDQPTDCDATPRPAGCDPQPPNVDNTDVSVTKVSDLAQNARVKPDQQFTYTFTATNAGTEAATGVKVTDTLPDGLEYVPVAGDGWTASGRTLTSAAFDLAPNGGAKTLTLKVKVTGGIQPGASIVNTGCTTGLHTDVCGTDPKPPTFDDSDIQLTKTNDTAKWNRQVRAGETYTYSITATNTGHTTADGVVVTDTLPVGLEFASASQSGWASLTGRTATSNPLQLAGGKSATLTLAVKVSANVTPGTQLINASAVDGQITPDQCLTNPKLPGCGVDPEPPTVVDHSAVTIAKTSNAAGKILKVGDKYTYTITVRNGGTTPARAVQVSDTLPTGLDFDGSQPGWTITGATATRTLDTLAVGASQDLTLTVKVAASAQSGALKNIAVLDDRSPADCAANPDLAGCGVDPNPPRIDLSDVRLAKSNSLGGATTVNPGQVFSYTITATNAGTGPATDTKVVDLLPAGLEFYPATQTGWVMSGQQATTTIPSLAAGATERLTLQVRVAVTAANGTEIVNAARAIDPSRPDDPQSPADCLTDRTLPGCGVDPKPPVIDRNVMQISKTHKLGAGSLMVSRGQPFGYDITVRNLGYLDADSVSVTDRLPDGVQYASTSQPGWASINGTDAISAPFTVRAGSSATVHVATLATKAPQSLLRNVAALTGWQMAGQQITASGVTGGTSVSAPTGIGHTIEQCVGDPTQAGCAYDDIAGSSERTGVTLTKSNNVTGGIVKVGDTYTYTLTATNTSDATSTGITLSDTLPTGLEYAGAQAGWNVSGQTASLGAPFDLAAGASKSFTLKVTVTASASGTIRNVAVMDDRNPDDCAVNPALAGCGVDPNPPIFDAGASVLSLKKTGAVTDVNLNGKVDAGDQIAYTFTVTNTGTNSADAGLEILDPMLEAAGISVTCDSSQIEPGASVTCHASSPYTVTLRDQMAGKIRNVAAAAIGDTVSRPAAFEVTTSGEVDCSACAGAVPTTGCTQPGCGGLPTTGTGDTGIGDTGTGTTGLTGGTGQVGTGATGPLPSTGATVLATSLFALALLATGAVMVLWRRRRAVDRSGE